MVTAHDLEGTVVAPPVGIADLIGDGVQFGERLLPGRLLHPGQGLDLSLHCGFDALDHGERVLLGLGAKVASDISLAKRFSEVSIDIVGATLPARRQLPVYPAEPCRRN